MLTVQYEAVSCRPALLAAVCAVVLVLGACTLRHYHHGTAEVTEAADGWYVVKAVGEKLGEHSDVRNILMLRAAEFAIKNKKPFLKFREPREGRRVHYRVKYVDGVERSRRPTGWSPIVSAEFYLVGKAERRDQKVISADQIISKFGHLRKAAN